MILVRLRELLEENLIFIKHNGETFPPVQAGILFPSLRHRTKLDIPFPVCFETQIISTNNTHKLPQHFQECLSNFLYDINQNCSCRCRILSLTSSYFALRNFFLICCQTKITSSQMHALFFTFVPAEQFCRQV